MKTLILASLLMTSSICFAGPEDHIQAQTCYSLVDQDLSKVSDLAPKELCFEELSINTNENKLYVYSYFNHYQKFLNDLKITSLIRQTEDAYSYKAEKVLFEQTERHCEDGLKLVLKLEGNVDFAGYGDIGSQNLSLVQETKADVCHSKAEVTVFKYVRTY